MKRSIVMIGVLCLTVSVVGCSKSLAEAGAGAIVELEGNPTTGYVWEVEIGNTDMIKEVANEYISGQPEDDVVGVGGIFRFTFEGLTQGETEIIFKYQRPWEEDIPPVETVTYIAVVDGSHGVTLIRK